ncbi:signal transduction histidine kinase [Lysinibacillus parviboronicapiens]|uniref:histidine kinase n=1 Tax=Lysinibacillus parviboronicapiens TaxID=436516 RepID=A0ABV2PL34_9BACI
MLEADELLFKHSLDNIITNAKKYTPDGTKVSVEAQNIDNKIMLTIADKGPGILRRSLITSVSDIIKGLILRTIQKVQVYAWLLLSS